MTDTGTGTFTPLDIGAVGDEVLSVQRYVGVPETGLYDSITAAGVANFQYRQQLPRTGIFDEATDAVMFPQVPLATVNSLETAAPPFPQTGMLDRLTVCALQCTLGIKQDGFIGDDTAAAMEEAGIGNLIHFQYANTWVEEIAQLQEALSLGSSLSPESEEPL